MIRLLRVAQQNRKQCIIWLVLPLPDIPYTESYMCSYFGTFSFTPNELENSLHVLQTEKKIRTTLDGRVRQPNRRKSDKILFSHDQNHFQFSYFLCYAVMWHEKIGFIFISMEGKIHADSTVGLNFYCRFNSTLKIKTT